MVGSSEDVPQLFVTLIVCPVTVAKLVYRAFSAVADSLQGPIVRVYLMPVQSIDVRLVHPKNIVDRLAADEPAPIFSEGTLVREEQP